MPEATVNKNDLFAGGEHQIRRAGKLAHVKPVPVTESMNEPSYRELGSCVLASDA
jgi:hypothetical protein